MSPIDSAFALDAFAADDEEAPTLTDIDPPAGSTLGPSDVFSFVVSDDTGLDVLRVQVRQQVWETVYEEGAFSQGYRAASTVTEQEDGSLLFNVRRTPAGWTRSPIDVRVRATDTEGSEA